MGSPAKAAILAMAVGLIAGAAPASAEVAYTTETSTGASFISGGSDIGNHGDDTTTAIAFPFSISFYGQTYSGGFASSNGNLQLTGNNAGYTIGCLPAANLGASIVPHLDDLRTDTSGLGVFTQTLGFGAHRSFMIRWQTQSFSLNDTANFEILLYEDSPIITVVYETITAGGSSATSGVQAAGTGPFTQFSCNTPATLTNGLRVDYIPHEVVPDAASDPSPGPGALPTGQRAAALAKCKQRARKNHWSHQRLKKCKKRANLLPV